MARKGRKRERRRTRVEASRGIAVVGTVELLKMECLLPDEEDDDDACCRVEIFVTN